MSCGPAQAMCIYNQTKGTNYCHSKQFWNISLHTMKGKDERRDAQNKQHNSERAHTLTVQKVQSRFTRQLSVTLLKGMSLHQQIGYIQGMQEREEKSKCETRYMIQKIAQLVVIFALFAVLALKTKCKEGTLIDKELQMQPK